MRLRLFRSPTAASRSAPRSRGRQRAFSLIEALVAIVVLTIAFLAWSQGMILATQAENKSANHTTAIAVANYQLELMRRDGNFWQECSSSPPCWDKNPPNDPFGNALPPYNDDLSNPSPANAHPASHPQYGNYSFLWRADDRTDDSNLVTITVYVFLVTDGRQETYKTTGTVRQAI